MRTRLLGVPLTVFGAAFAAIGAGGQNPAAQPPVIRVQSQLVRLTVVARDHSGHGVSGMTASDFAVTEDGKPVKIASFHEVAGPSATPTPAPQTQPATAGVFTNRMAGAPGDVTVILLDRLNTKWLGIARTRDALKLFFAKVRPDDRIAVYALDETALWVLQDFTSDTTALLKAVNGAADAPDARTSTFQDANLGPEYASQMNRLVASTSLAALETIAQHLANIPGRKNLIWVSAGFPFGFDSASTTLSGLDPTSEMHTAARALNTSDVSLYGVDPRGLVTGCHMTATSDVCGDALAILSNEDIVKAIAERTGGRVFLNNNDIADSVRAAIDDAEHHYEIDYYSPSPASDGHYRAITVTSRKSGVDLGYRRGYFAVAAFAPGGDRKTALERAIGDPLEATAIPITVTPAKGTGTSIDLSIHAGPGGLTLADGRGGAWTGGLDAAIAQVRSDGTTTVDVDTTVALTLRADQHDAIMRDGLTITKSITLGPGTVRVVVVLRDAPSGALGSVTIPASALQQIQQR